MLEKKLFLEAFLAFPVFLKIFSVEQETLIYREDIEKHSFIEKTYVVGTRYEAIPMYSTGNKESYFEVYTYKVACPLFLPLSKISNCQSVGKYV